MSCEVYLTVIRHAESEGNVEKIVQGSSEYPLTEHGREQARIASVAARLLDPSYVASSTLSRAYETAEILFGVEAVRWVDLVERGAGLWEGVKRTEILEKHPGSLENDNDRPEGYEPLSEVVLRARRSLCQIGEKTAEIGDRGAVVCHGAVMRALYNDLTGKETRFSHLEYMVLKYDGESITFKELGTLIPSVSGGIKASQS